MMCLCEKKKNMVKWFKIYEIVVFIKGKNEGLLKRKKKAKKKKTVTKRVVIASFLNPNILFPR